MLSHVQDSKPFQRPLQAVTTLDIMRVHGLDELHLQDDQTLTAYQKLLALQIGRGEASIRSNMIREFKATIQQELRLYRTINDKISTILTARLHQKNSI